MSDESWEEQFKQFLRKTGDDVRRASDDIRVEAQRLFDAAMDPEKQQRVRDRLSELGLWARKTAQDVAGAVEQAAGKAETAFHSGMERMSEATGTVSGSARPASGSAAPRKSAPAKTKKASPAKGKAKPGKAKAKPAAKTRGKTAAKRKR